MIELHRSLIADGFAFISDVTISTDDMPCFISDAHAVKQSLFYHSRTLAFLVRVEHLVLTYPDQRQGLDSWQINFWWDMIPRWELVQRSFNAEKYRTEYWRDDHFDIPVVGYNAELVVPDGFRNCGCGGQYSLEMTAAVPRSGPKLFASILEAIRSVRDQVKPILMEKFCQPKRTSRPWGSRREEEYEINLWELVPTYVFPGCGEAFKRRFDVRYFRSIVRRGRNHV